MQNIAVAISGGIDSLMAAHLLKKQGHKVFGIHFVTGFEGYDQKTDDDSPKSTESLVEHIKAQLDIEIEVVDIRNEFKSEVVDYFTSTYLAGNTPNPCLVCNPSIKFGIILQTALKRGAQSLATGHYARILKDSEGKFHLHKGLDSFKDQSYFLSFLSQEQLSKINFPLGYLTKDQIRIIAKEEGLSSVSSGESQDICFIKGKDYKAFLSDQPGFENSPGNIVNTSGELIGKHNGLHAFTIGQRKGINCPAPEPYYVLRLDMKENKLVVGGKSDLLVSECKVRDVSWINNKPDGPIKAFTKIRYGHPETESTIIPGDNNSVTVIFDTPLSAITPGQGAVFYDGDEIIGAGWIES